MRIVLSSLLVLVALSADAQVAGSRGEWSLPPTVVLRVPAGNICSWCECCMKRLNPGPMGLLWQGKANTGFIMESQMFDALRVMRRGGVPKSTVNRVLESLGRTGWRDFCEECKCCHVRGLSVVIDPRGKSRQQFRSKYYIWGK